MSNLSDRAMLASVTISMWSARKFDRKITDKVNREHGAKKDAGRFNKKLLAGKALSDIGGCGSRARAKFYERTVPWLDDGSRILSTAAYDKFTEEMRTLRVEFEEHVAKFVEAYPAMVEQARIDLNGMFSQADYPSPKIIAKKFGLVTRFMPVPRSEDFRASVSKEQAAMIRREIEEATREAITGALKNVYERIAEVVGHMNERLSNYNPKVKKGEGLKGRFHDSLVDNVRELVELLPTLNVTDDPGIAAIAERMKRDLCRSNAEILRSSETTRKSVASAAAKILSDVSEFI